jgi:5-methylcytosine-specific restriction protein A
MRRLQVRATAMSWNTSDRRARLPRNWAKLREQVKRRAGGLCQAKQHEPDCSGAGNECDHVINNDDHSLTNLQWLSGPCHRARTLQQATEARARRSRKRPTPQPISEVNS